MVQVVRALRNWAGVWEIFETLRVYGSEVPRKLGWQSQTQIPIILPIIRFPPQLISGQVGATVSLAGILRPRELVLSVSLLSTVLCRLPSSAGSNVTFSRRLALTILFKIASYPLPQLFPPSSSAEMCSMLLVHALYHVCIYSVYCLFPLLACKL